ncbi:MAG TPA: hypothetical protein VN788_13265 [Verrucomicrobiae bacterium]|nr:hypothetical protein [Verrucomicrobiae bacterium]
MRDRCRTTTWLNLVSLNGGKRGNVDGLPLLHIGMLFFKRAVIGAVNLNETCYFVFYEMLTWV